VPVSLDGVALSPEPLIAELNRIVGSYGYGRLDMVENRRVGIKSRETYECPGALALLLAHAGPRGPDPGAGPPPREAPARAPLAELVYDGLWFSPLKQALDAFFLESQRHVTGEVRLRLDQGRCWSSDDAARSASTTTGSPLRRFGHVPTPGRRGLRAPLGPGCGHLVGRPGGTRRRPHRAMTLWHGRLSGGTADVVMDYSVSLDVDRRLATTTSRLAGPRARPGPRWPPERGGGDDPLDTLDLVEAELDAATFVFAPDDEDIHTAVERRVTELAGDVGRSSTRAGAATTRWRRTSGSTPSAS